MITLRDKLIEEATSQAERDLIAMWLSEEHDELSARQRAWQEVQSRGSLGAIQFSW